MNARVALAEMPGLGGQWEIALWGKNLADTNCEAFTLDNLPQARSCSHLGRWAQLRHGCDLPL
ncbi:MAG: hypothetical protein IPG64_20955 [Haliea sp.]|nr:hypothetical protein [Haliea sp.]